MEEDKKKKKNKKKKNKQATKPTENVTLDARESASDSQSNVSYMGQENGQVSRTIGNDTGGYKDADRDEHLANGLEGTNLAKAEKRSCLDKEASFQEKIKELQAEKNAQTKKEALLKEKINQLLNEKDEISQKEASQKEEIKQLHIEKNASIQNEESRREVVSDSVHLTGRPKGENYPIGKGKKHNNPERGSLEQKIQQLQREMDAHLQKEASLETKFLQLEDEKNSWVQKEAGLEEKIDRLVEEAAFLNLKGVKMSELTRKAKTAGKRKRFLDPERAMVELLVVPFGSYRNRGRRECMVIIGFCWLTNSAKESIARLTCDNTNLQAQIEAARALVEKLISENSELVEKVNELYAELDRRGARTEYIFSSGSVPGAVRAQSADIADGSALKPDWAVGADDRHRTAQVADSISDASQMMPFSGSNQSLEDIMIEDERNSEHVNQNGDSELAKFAEISEADEIVQIPLDENEVRETNIEVAQLDEKTDVPLTDAPLIGAPFRLISFVARYVSGADLVNRST
ncbi:UNVERIFIED_CONTAM: hypothetical protein Slati_1645200 [Sesamum latifolium]|uniref:Uncharacterized protein n=1 Tax=Sesamum latifolium TaxID=2727402 RepID=A0AAW2XAL6_9LAMI